MTNDDKLKKTQDALAQLCGKVRNAVEEISFNLNTGGKHRDATSIIESCSSLLDACGVAKKSAEMETTEHNVAHEDEGRGADTRKDDVFGGDEEACEDDGKFTMATRAKQLAMTMRSIMDVMAVENHDGLYARGLNYEYGIMRDKVKRIIAIGDYYRHVADELKRVGYGKTAKLFAELACELRFEKECADDVHWCRGRDDDNAG